MFKKYIYIGLIIIFSFLILSGCTKDETVEQATDKEAGIRLTAQECLDTGNPKATEWQDDYRFSQLTFQTDSGMTGDGLTSSCKVFYLGNSGQKSLKVEILGNDVNTEKGDVDGAIFDMLSNPKIINSPKIIEIAKADKPLLKEINQLLEKNPDLKEADVIQLEKIYFDSDFEKYLWVIAIGHPNWREEKSQFTRYSFNAEKGDLMSIVVYKYIEEKGYFNRLEIPVEPPE